MSKARFNLEDIEAGIDDMTGFCAACGAARGGRQPGARRYGCEVRAARSVYGAEEFFLMGRVDQARGS